MAEDRSRAVFSLEEFSLQRLLGFFLKRWYILVIAGILGFSASYMYMRYTPKLYKAQGNLKIKDDNRLESLGFLTDLDNYTDNIQTEILYLKSRSMAMQALEEIDYSVAFFAEGRIKQTELYKDSPFKVHFENGRNKLPYGQEFYLRYKGKSEFVFYSEGESADPKKSYFFGQPIKVGDAVFSIARNEESSLVPSKSLRYRMHFNKPKDLVGRVRSGLEVEQQKYGVSILQVTYTDQVPRFASDFINTLCKVYEKDNKKGQTEAADSVLAFIDREIIRMGYKVDSSEQALAKIKQDNEFYDPQMKISETSTKLAELETRILELGIEEGALKKMIRQINSNTEVSMLPLSFGGSASPSLLPLVQSYNTVYIDRLSLLNRYPENSDIVKATDQKLAELRKVVLQQMENSLTSFSTKKRKFQSQVDSIKGIRDSIPGTEMQYLGLQRDYKVRESVFTKLLEKQAEASISKHSIVSSIQIIDEALVPKRPVSPKLMQVYIVGVSAAMLIGACLILMIGFLRNYIEYKSDLESLTSASVLGTVTKEALGLNRPFPLLVVLNNQKSAFAEGLRRIRSNIQFVLKRKETKLICLTSTVSGEGKSFISINLAGIISTLEKKVMILDMDMRRPKLHFSFDIKNDIGLSTFLAERDELKDIIKKTEFDNIDVITSGPIPPNPAELLQSEELDRLVEELKEKYDYIIFDLPPVGLVTDGLSIFQKSDLILYVFRARYSKRSYAKVLEQVKADHKYDNIYAILNTVDSGGGKYGGYAGNYSYGSNKYYEEASSKKKWWQIWKKA